MGKFLGWFFIFLLKFQESLELTSIFSFLAQVNPLEPQEVVSDEDMPIVDTTTSSFSDTKTSFKYGKLILMFFHQLY
jgi:hypothetical protein